MVQKVLKYGVKKSMNPQQQYEDTLEVVRKQFRLARELNKEARLEWHQEVKKLLQQEMDSADLSTYDSDGF